MSIVGADLAQDRLVAISNWIDTSPANAGRDPEALAWHRVCKPAEEMGEVVDEMIKFVGGNPRKLTEDDFAANLPPRYELIDELLDVAVAALGGIEHLYGNSGVSIQMLFNKIARVKARALEGKE